MPIDRALLALETLMGRVFVTAESHAYDVLLDLNLSLSQARTLFLLAVRTDPLPINEIAHLVRLSPAATGRSIDQLVTMDLVSREECPSDRRVKLVALTDRGRHVMMAHFESKRDAIRALLATLDATQQEAIADSLTPLIPSSQKEAHDG